MSDVHGTNSTTMKRLRAFIESIVFAGMKPDAQRVQPGPQWKGLGRLSGPVDRLLSGGLAPTDPLYLSNRSLGQKIRSWSLIGVPCLVLLGGIAFVLSSLMSPPDVKPAKELTASEIAAKMLPEMTKDLKVTTNHDVEVVEVKVDNTNGPKLMGTVRNTTDHEIAFAEIIVDITNSGGSQLGAVTGTVEKIPAKGTKAFQSSIAQPDGAIALVRQVNIR
jgi:hypothetical protein